MSRAMIAAAGFAALAAVALTGCVLEGRRSTAHVSAGVSVRAEHNYTYFPSHDAYYCDSCDDWWVHDSGSWSHHAVRPPSIVIRDDTPWLVVNVRDGQPHLRNADHRRDFESHGREGKSKGPPPGRGWRK